VHEPDAPELEPSLGLQHRFEQGQQVGELARSYVPGGVLIDAPHNRIDERVRATREALEAGAPVLYEASFAADGVFAAVDILERVERGFGLIEVKSSSRVKEEHLPDAAIQAHVLGRCGLEVSRTEVMHLNRSCHHPDLSDLFMRTDVTAAVDERLPSIPEEIDAQLRILDGPFPGTGIGDHCQLHRDCAFRERCWPRTTPDHILALAQVGPAKKLELMRRGFYSIAGLPREIKLPKVAQRQVRALNRNGMIVGRGLDEDLGQFRSPLAFLDFETVSLAIPVWDGCRPWDLMPVQFSCHVEPAPGRLTHHEYLAQSGADCREALAGALVDACRDARGIVVYNRSFERRCIRKLIEAVPALADELRQLDDKLLDLLPVVRDRVYHPDFLGSFGLKSVLPVLVPELGYDDLEISDGEAASIFLARLLFQPGTVSPEEQPALRRKLLEYCQRDTWAMVVLLGKLMQLAKLRRHTWRE
jgi:predicted RecB family nuclease